MSRTLTASDRKRLIKMASTMAVGSPERKAVLAGLSKSAGKAGDFKVGDLVRHTRKFLRNTGMAVGAPIDGKVVEVYSEGYFAGHPVVQWSDGSGPSLIRAENIQHARRRASGSKSASWVRSLQRRIESDLKQHPAFMSVLDSASDENVLAFLVEYAEGHAGYEGGIRVEVYDENGELLSEEVAPRGNRTNLRPYVKDAQREWGEAYRSASGRQAGLQSKGLKAVKLASDSPLLMPVQGSPKMVMPANGTDFTLREAQKMIGGYVEVVYLRDGRIMLADEEGLLKSLPLNRAASRMAGRPIVGPALVMPNDMFR